MAGWVFFLLAGWLAGWLLAAQYFPGCREGRTGMWAENNPLPAAFNRLYETLLPAQIVEIQCIVHHIAAVRAELCDANPSTSGGAAAKANYFQVL
jgi:hypothetical protein